MGWWVSPKNIYGLIMGTSTDVMKRTDRPHWPTAVHTQSPKLDIFLGGTGNCGILRTQHKTLLINCNSGRSAKVLAGALVDASPTTFVGTSIFPDYMGAIAQFHLVEAYYPQWDGEMQPEIPYAIPQIPVEKETVLEWGRERIVITPVEGVFSQRDLVIYLEDQRVLFLGGLFFNRIHPVLDATRGGDPDKWIQTLDTLLARFPCDTIVPHEGDVCGPEGVRLFQSYLKALSDRSVDFSYCRENFDWFEIPGHTSLEENFDHFRK